MEAALFLLLRAALVNRFVRSHVILMRREGRKRRAALESLFCACLDAITRLDMNRTSSHMLDINCRSPV